MKYSEGGVALDEGSPLDPKPIMFGHWIVSGDIFCARRKSLGMVRKFVPAFVWWGTGPLAGGVAGSPVCFMSAVARSQGGLRRRVSRRHLLAATGLCMTSFQLLVQGTLWAMNSYFRSLPITMLPLRFCRRRGGWYAESEALLGLDELDCVIKHVCLLVASESYYSLQILGTAFFPKA